MPKLNFDIQNSNFFWYLRQAGTRHTSGLLKKLARIYWNPCEKPHYMLLLNAKPS